MTIQTAWICFDFKGEPYWPSAHGTYDESMQNCFGNRYTSGKNLLSKDHWQNCLDAGWTCREFSIDSTSAPSFQARCHDWANRCIGLEDATNVPMRIHRFLEEALELGQALGGLRDEAHQLVDYVFNRGKGEPAQEVGGVMTTLGTLCAAASLDMERDGERELERVNRSEVIEKVRRKHQAKPKFGPLPEVA